MFFFFMSFFFSFVFLVSAYFSFLFVVKGKKALVALKSAIISYLTPLSPGVKKKEKINGCVT